MRLDSLVIGASHDDPIHCTSGRGHAGGSTGSLDYASDWRCDHWNFGALDRIPDHETIRPLGLDDDHPVECGGDLGRLVALYHSLHEFLA